MFIYGIHSTVPVSAHVVSSAVTHKTSMCVCGAGEWTWSSEPMNGGRGHGTAGREAGEGQAWVAQNLLSSSTMDVGSMSADGACACSSTLGTDHGKQELAPQ